MINQVGQETKIEIEDLFNKIGAMGYFSPEVKLFRQKLQKKNKEEIEEWIEDNITSFLKKAHPGKLYALTGTVIILSLSERTINIIADQIFEILQKELKKLGKDPHYKFNQIGVDLRLGCIKFLSDLQRKLNQPNQKKCFKILGEIGKSKNENELVKQAILEKEHF